MTISEKIDIFKNEFNIDDFVAHKYLQYTNCDLEASHELYKNTHTYLKYTKSDLEKAQKLYNFFSFVYGNKQATDDDIKQIINILEDIRWDEQQAILMFTT